MRSVATRSKILRDSSRALLYSLTCLAKASVTIIESLSPSQSTLSHMVVSRLGNVIPCTSGASPSPSVHRSSIGSCIQGWKSCQATATGFRTCTRQLFSFSPAGVMTLLCLLLLSTSLRSLGSGLRWNTSSKQFRSCLRSCRVLSDTLGNPLLPFSPLVQLFHSRIQCCLSLLWEE